MTLDEKARIIRNAQIVFSEMDDEIVMMDLKAGEYYGLNQVGARIWELLDQPRSISEITETLCREYDVSPEQCLTEVQNFLEVMLENGSVQVLDE